MLLLQSFILISKKFRFGQNNKNNPKSNKKKPITGNTASHSYWFQIIDNEYSWIFDFVIMDIQWTIA